MESIDLKNRLHEIELELQTKHLEFLKNYLKNGFNTKDAYLKVYTNASVGTATRNAFNILSQPISKEYIALQMREIEPLVNVNKIKQIQSYLKIANDPNEKTINVLKALERIDRLMRYESPVSIELSRESEISLSNFSDSEKQNLLELARKSN